jgi:hypothetical protein
MIAEVIDGELNHLAVHREGSKHGVRPLDQVMVLTAIVGVNHRDLDDLRGPGVIIIKKTELDEVCGTLMFVAVLTNLRLVLVTPGSLTVGAIDRNKNSLAVTAHVRIDIFSPFLTSNMVSLGVDVKGTHGFGFPSLARFVCFGA